MSTNRKYEKHEFYMKIVDWWDLDTAAFSWHR